MSELVSMYQDLLFSSYPTEMLKGLAWRTRQPGASERMEQVYTAMENAARSGSSELPDGVSEEMWRFLAVTAGLGLWDKLDEKDPRIADAILQFYTVDDVTFGDIVGTVSGIGTKQGVRELVVKGIQLLWDALPEGNLITCPGLTLNKEIDFSPERLRRGQRRRQIEGSQEASRRRWNDPDRRATGEAQLRRAREANERGKAFDLEEWLRTLQETQE